MDCSLYDVCTSMEKGPYARNDGCLGTHGSLSEHLRQVATSLCIGARKRRQRRMVSTQSAQKNGIETPSVLPVPWGRPSCEDEDQARRHLTVQARIISDRKTSEYRTVGVIAKRLLADIQHGEDLRISG